MSTTMVVQTNLDIERAVPPTGLSQRLGLPVPVLMSSNRLIRSVRSFNISLTLLRVIKFSVGALVGTLSLMSAWWALDLAMWTSVKDFREDCRGQLQNFNSTSLACQEVLSRPLMEPPTWRGYLGKAKETFSGRTGYHYIRDEGSSRGQLASRSPRPYPTMHDEWGFEQVAREGIRRQGDAAIMYGGMESYLKTAFPLDEASQEYFDYFWDLFEENSLCVVWLNKTVTGAVEDIQPVFIPDQRDEPRAFDECLTFMPPTVRSEPRRWCTYPSVPSPVHISIDTWSDWFTKAERDYGPALALTFFLVAMGHEILYGGFPRKTRWKWQ